MSKEEVIDTLKGLVFGTFERTTAKEREALDMAIEALRNCSEKPNGSLIRRQDALKSFCIAPDGTRIPEVDCDNFPVEFSVEFIKKHLLSLPSADAVEVVRCKDCKNRHEDECPMYWEEQFDIDEGDGYYDTDYIVHDYTQDDGFCSWGDRREP